MSMKRYSITQPRYIKGVYIFAAPGAPAVVELDLDPDRKLAPDMNLLEDDEQPVPEKLLPAHPARTSQVVPKASERDRRPEPKGDVKKRPSDGGPTA